jgi:hypothetical protein
MEKGPIVRMQKGIRYVPKPKIPEPVKKPIPAVRPTPKPIHRTTIRATPKPTFGPRPRPTPRPRKTMKRIPSPNPWANLNMNSTNLLYDPAKPSPKVKLDSSKLFQKMKELQDMLKALKQNRQRNASMNASAKAYLNRASYEDPLLENSLKLTGIKGTALR